MDIQDIQSIKQRFKIIGNDPHLNRAIEIAVQVAGTDLTVLINGESGTGKDVFPQIIHQNSSENIRNTSPSTAERFQKELSTRNYLVMRKALSQELMRQERDILKKPTAEQYSSMK